MDREAKAAYDRLYRAANKQRIREQQRAYYETKKDLYKAKARDWALANPEKRREMRQRWRQQHPERHRDEERQRRALKRGATVAVVKESDIFQRDNWICQLCHKRVNPNRQWPDPLSASLDHIIPLALGGTHEPANVQLAHYQCNCRKLTRAVGEQLRLIG